MDFFSNPWVIGIGGGILSGLLVTLITRHLFSKRERREYFQKVATANNEIIYVIRPAIAEKVIPSTEMLEALFSATARKYSVDESDLYSKVGLANELIKEVMDNTFLSYQQKVDFCALLASLKEVKKEGPEVQHVVEYITVNRGSSVDMSSVLGIVTAVMALTTTLYIYVSNKDDFLSDGLTEVSSRIFPLILVMTLIPIMAVFLKDFLRKVRRVDSEVTIKRQDRPKEKQVKADKEPNKPMQPTADASAD